MIHARVVKVGWVAQIEVLVRAAPRVERCAAEPGLLARGPDFALYLVYDALADAHFALVDALSSEVEELADEVKAHVAQHLGPIVRPEKVTFVESLPKTRSGKIMRRVLKARAQGLPEGDVSTLEE